MAENKNLPVITISREYGAGGRSVARRLSERLGIEFYDIDVVRMAAKESGYTEEDIKQIGEEMSGAASFINHFFTTPASYISAMDHINRIEHEVILKLAMKGPCIIVGRSSAIYLREAGIKCFNVFLHADMPHRIERAKHLNENGKMDLEKYVKQRDAYRKNYIKTYTGHELGAYEDYDLSIDTGVLTYDKAVDLIVSAVSE